MSDLLLDLLAEEGQRLQGMLVADIVVGSQLLTKLLFHIHHIEVCLKSIDAIWDL